MLTKPKGAPVLDDAAQPLPALDCLPFTSSDEEENAFKPIFFSRNTQPKLILIHIACPNIFRDMKTDIWQHTTDVSG